MKEVSNNNGSKKVEKDTDGMMVGLIVYSTIIAAVAAVIVFFIERGKRIELEERIIALEKKKK